MPVVRFKICYLILFPMILTLGLLSDAHSENITTDFDEVEIAVGEWPPYLSEDLPQGGIMAQAIAEIFQDIGVEAKFRFLPWGRAYEETSRGAHTATGVWMHKAEREQDFIYSEAILTEQFVFFYNTDISFDWKTLKDIEKYRIGGGTKYSYGPAFDKAIAAGRIKIERVGNVHLNFRKLLTGRISLFPQEINVGYADLRRHLSEEDQARITHHPKPFLNNHSYVLFPRRVEKSEELVRLFNQKLRQYREDGRYDILMATLN
ncbi:substrate-binding periplasmic protein [Curvivirga sp.]|uniref:substrate-binding periplasmic protein n=1 Tax=Curvivirga sp. TaxID=2856848 RepID=UPI003B59CC13